MRDHNRSALPRASVTGHLTRGAIGFGLIAATIALAPSIGSAVLLLALPGMVALRGCPACWIASLIQTISAGRLKRTCTEASCTLNPIQLERDASQCLRSSGSSRADSTLAAAEPIGGRPQRRRSV
jgi:hypothetical protein